MHRCYCKAVTLLLITVASYSYYFYFTSPWNSLKYKEVAVVTTAAKPSRFGAAVQAFNRSSVSKTHHPASNISYRGPFLKSSKNVLNLTPPVFDPAFKNPCWYDRGKKTRRLHCLPYFLVIGMEKSGTTDLYQRIEDHPDITGADTKEPDFWRWYMFGNRNSANPISTYASYFSKQSRILQESKNNDNVTGEGTPSLLWDNRWWWQHKENQNDEEPGYTIAHIIRHITPDAKILVILRNPTDRLYSEYLFFKRDNKPISADDFHKAVSRGLNNFNKCMTKHTLRHCAHTAPRVKTAHVRVAVGLYAVFLKDWFDVFPRDQILIIKLEDYSVHRREAMSTIYKFLNLRDLSEKYGNSSIHANEKPKKKKNLGEMKNKTRLLLDTFYKPYNKALAELLDDERWNF